MQRVPNQSEDGTAVPKSVSISEAKSKLSSIIGWVRERGDAVIVQSCGGPRAVILSYAEYEKVQSLREQQRRREALGRLRKLQAEVSRRNRDLTEEQAEGLAEQFSREVIEEMAAEATPELPGCAADVEIATELCRPIPPLEGRALIA